MKKWFFTICMVMILAVGLAGCTTNGTATPAQTDASQQVVISNQQEGISVSGQGKVSAAPDIAILSLGVQDTQATVAVAQANASDAMNKVVSALTGNGVANKDIQTQRFSIQVLTRYDDKTQSNVILGYQVTNIVTAKIRALDKVGTIIDAVAVAGGDLTRIDGISFSVENPTSLTNQAREQAMADAKAKAEQMARLAGVTLGKPTFISESVAYPVPSPISRIGAPTAETSISPGEIDISATVQINYAILK